MEKTGEISKQPDFLKTQNIPVIDKEKRGKLVKLATGIKDGFVSWTNKHILKGWSVHDYGKAEQELTVDYFVEQVKNSPSKDFLKKTLALVGLYDIGLTVASLQMDIPKEIIPIIWSSTFFAPVSEELLFRSRVIHEIIIGITQRMGLNVRSDTARILTNAIFTVGHLENADLKKFLTGAYLTKIANEKGLAASIAAHSLINASIWGLAYLTVAAEKFTPSQAETAKAALQATFWTGIITIGIKGTKEMMEDRQIQNALEKLRSTDRINKSLEIPKIKDMYSKLLQQSSAKGYKFTTGVELAHITGMLESFEFIHQPEMRDKYALEHVRKAISESCPDPEKLDERLVIAFDYIDRELKLKPQVIETPVVTPAISESTF